MTFYIIVFFILWGGFFSSVALGRKFILVDLLALAIFILVAGQRIETGNDWLVYRDHYADLQQFGLFSVSAQSIAVFEPFYVITSWIFGQFFSFQAFLLIVAFFNGIVLYWFTKIFKANFSGVVAIYYSWLYLSTQMATIRYSIAISFFMIAVIYFLKQKNWNAFLLTFVGVGFHAFTIVFLPLLFFSRKKFDFRQLIFILIAAGICVYALYFLLITGWGDGIPFVAKLGFYLQEGTVDSLSLGLLVYIGINLSFLFWIKHQKDNSLEIRIIEWSIFYLIFFQIVLWMIPIFWSRVQIFVLMIQACVLARHMVSGRNILLFSFWMSISLFVIFRSLSSPAFVSYIPYQSYLINELFFNSVRDDGEARYFEALDQQSISNEK